MIVAIYARKSTEQHGIADEQKSVARQVEHARQYAERKGWTVDEACVFVDDGMSGAEFALRPGFLRMMNGLNPRPPFQVLVMSEESRLGREMVQTMVALQQLVCAGVRVFYYLTDTERTMDSPIEKAMMALEAFGAELERDKARQRTYDAMMRKARAGHVTGGRVFGYENVDVVGPNGERSHVERRILPNEADVVRRIFHMTTEGKGYRTIAEVLNTARLPSPRAQQGRPKGWAPSSVRELLHRELYRGVIVWNKTRKRDKLGRKRPQARGVLEPVRVSAPHLRIVSDELWEAAHARMETTRRTYLRGTHGHLWGRPSNGIESKYLLTGLARCGGCGASLVVRSRHHGKRRAFYYACSAFHRRGGAVCSNSLEMRLEAADEAILTALEGQLLDDSIITEAMAEAVARLQSPGEDLVARKDRLQRKLNDLSADLERLTAAVLAGGEAATLVAAMRDRERQAASVRQELAAMERPRRTDTTMPTLQRAMRQRLTEWRTVLRAHVPQARQMLRKLIDGRINFTPDTELRRYRFVIPGTLGLFFKGLVDPQMVASPNGLADFYTMAGAARRAA